MLRTSKTIGFDATFFIRVVNSLSIPLNLLNSDASIVLISADPKNIPSK